MMNTFACATFYDFAVGGVPTYYLRMFKWAMEKKKSCVLYIKKNRTIADNMKNELRRLNVKVIPFSIKISGLCLDSTSNANQKKMDKDDVLITSDIHCFMHFMNDSTFSACKGYLYVLHPRATQVTRLKGINYLYKKYLRLNFNRSIVFMDWETAHSYSEYYHAPVDNRFFHVGDFIPEYDKKLVYEKAVRRKEKVNILTVARMDFPFKGYVYGLVDNISRIQLTTAEIHLFVVGDGKDFKLIERLADQQKESEVKVHLCGNISYGDLENYYKSATVFAGGGTTLIEACKFGTPSIITLDNQMGADCIGYMNEWPENMGGTIEDTKHDVIDLINNLCIMSDDEYVKISEDSYKAVKLNYDIYEIMNQLLGHHGGYKKASSIVMFCDYILVKVKELVKE